MGALSHPRQARFCLLTVANVGRLCMHMHTHAANVGHMRLFACMHVHVSFHVHGRSALRDLVSSLFLSVTVFTPGSEGLAAWGDTRL